jgi:hypothetical protein
MLVTGYAVIPSSSNTFRCSRVGHVTTVIRYSDMMAVTMVSRTTVDRSASSERKLCTGWPDAGAGAHAEHVMQTQSGDTDAEVGLIAILALLWQFSRFRRSCLRFAFPI